MSETSHRQWLLHGVTQDGKVFRPSDWAERLCGVANCFLENPLDPRQLYYSAYVRPFQSTGDSYRSVLLDERLQKLEARAYDFFMNFARDNKLLVTEFCALEDPLKKKT